METSVGTKRSAEELDIVEQLPAKKPVQFIVREPSIFNIKPVDDVVKYIADFIGKHCHLKNVEVYIYIYINTTHFVRLLTIIYISISQIEAKFGVFVDKYSKRRINLNAHTETSKQKKKKKKIVIQHQFQHNFISFGRWFRKKFSI